ncbi:MAG TPA: 1-(5-phosphoribosyl)-5-((5-phosphoribosylamino)methylideneamino)imidazole-4-carboxamide isomerase, partial [Anaerolineae bacterium]|nr:1-(5-phosphoribosyl)-5-((5-phosphoribosylamino)methylideneamino)imidazole-4-carboxamide isomerase [Anaerolineae bacterium]
MILFPAIDLRKGKCVRLLQGDPNAQTTYANDPAQVAEQFAEQGAEWLHVVNLDGAFGDADTGQNREALQAILDSVDIPIQVGGGVRSLDDIERLLDMGVTRVILGTMVAERPRQMP